MGEFEHRSIWAEGVELKKFPTLDRNTETDVLIIGGGMAGILTAYMLKEAGVECILVEADRICCGTTGNTTAKLTFAHGLIYDKLIRTRGLRAARLYLDMQKKALNTYAALCEKIPCDYEKRTSYVYSLSSGKRVAREVEALWRLGVSADFVNTPELPFATAGAVAVEDQAQFNPLKFVKGISEGLPIYENTRVREFMQGEVLTDRGRIKYKRAVVATHFPILNKHGSYFLKMYQHRSYVIALKCAPAIDGMYVDESHSGLSFRSSGELLLLGGGGHRTGKQGGCWQELEAFASEHYEGAEVVARWAAQDCITLDGMPYIGRYSKRTEGLFVATGFNKWGMSSSMAAAMLLRDLIKGRGSRYSELISPSRSILHPQLALNGAEALVNLLTPTAPRCPHLGCALKYNAAEHTWDCPCHGSRFSEHGELLDGPANGDRVR